jgi:hypothetical protein
VVQPIQQAVAQPKQQVAQPKQVVAQPIQQAVAQPKQQAVAQAVAQASWVAQGVVQTVAQSKPQTVVRFKTQVDKDVEKFKEQICQIPTIEGRKKFCIDIGFGISSQTRGGKQHYLFGIKKIEGKKYSLYIGNSRSL